MDRIGIASDSIVAGHVGAGRLGIETAVLSTDYADYADSDPEQMQNGIAEKPVRQNS